MQNNSEQNKVHLNVNEYSVYQLEIQTFQRSISDSVTEKKLYNS